MTEMTSSDNTTHSNLTIQIINDEQARLFYPVIGFVAVTMVLGLLGNMLVFFVYYSRFKRTPSNLFIMALAIIDTLLSTLVAPFEITDMLFPYTNGDVMLVPCKIFRFIGWTFNTLSSLTVACIAYERYCKISRPLAYFSLKRAKIMIVISVMFCATVSFPMLFMFGYRTELVEVDGVTYIGSDCSVSDDYTGTMFPKIYGFLMLLIFIVYFISYLYFYVCIAVIICRRTGSSLPSTPSACDEYSVSAETFNAVNNIALTNGNNHHDRTSSASSSRQSSVKGLHGIRPISGAKIRTTKLTAMFLIVTIVCVLSFLPLLVIDVIHAVLDIEKIRKDNPDMDLGLEFLQKTFCINFCSNPLIYGIMNPTFRKHAVEMVSGLFKYPCSKPRPPISPFVYSISSIRR